MSIEEVKDRQAQSDPATSAFEGESIEYRGISVMFIDLVGSTDLMESMDPEDFSDLVRGFHSVCNDMVRKRNGVVAQYQGDGVICYFGFPYASEDDAVRAVDAALGIQRALADSADQIQARIGISTGTAMIRSDGDHFGSNAVGACINRAARLEALAEPGRILVCDDTHHLIGELFQLRDMGEHELKGFKEPQRLYCVNRRNVGAATRFEALRGGRQTDLIGRGDELDWLLGHLRTVKNQGGRTIAINAEAGIGKSRLINAFQNHPELESTASFVLQCSPEQTGTPLYPIRTYLEWVSGAGRNDDAETRHAKLERLIKTAWGANDEELAVLLDLLSPLGSGMEIDQSESVPLRRQKAFALLSRMLFRSASGRSSMLLAIEDAHWIDPSSADLLQFLTAEAASHPALVVVTTRPEPPFGEDGVPGAVEQITLERLSKDDAYVLTRQILGNTELTEAQIDLIIEKSDGVPLFLEEYADMLRSAGSKGLSDTQIPLTLGGLVQSKLDRLPPGAQNFGKTAAAIGRSFDDVLIGAITKQSKSEIDENTAALVDLRLIEREDVSGTSNELTFSHALIRDAIYGTMNRGQRKHLHTAIVDQYLSQGGEMQVDEHVLAYHLARAGRPAEAIERYLNAAMSAAGTGAAAEALGHLEAALGSVNELPEGEERDRLELRIRAVQGPTLMVTRGPGNPDFGNTQSRAMDLVDRLDLHNTMVPVIYNTALHAWAIADLDRAMNISESIALIHDQDPTDAAYMAAHTMRGLIGWHQGKNALAEENLSATVERHDPDLHFDLYSVFLKEFGVFSLFYLGLTKTIQGDFDAGAKLADRAAELGKKMTFPHARGFGMLARFNCAMLRGDVNTADEASAEALEYSTRQGFPEMMAMSRFVQGWVTARNGDPASGVGEMQAGLEIWSATGFTCWQALFAAFLASDMVEIGNLSEAQELLDKYQASVDATGENQFLAPLALARAELLEAEGNISEAQGTATNAKNIAQQQGAMLWRDMVTERFGTA